MISQLLLQPNDLIASSQRRRHRSRYTAASACTTTTTTTAETNDTSTSTSSSSSSETLAGSLRRAFAGTLVVQEDNNNNNGRRRRSIPIQELLQACHLLQEAVTALGQTQSARDLSSNLQKVQEARAKHSTTLQRCQTLRSLLESEKKHCNVVVVKPQTNNGSPQLEDPSVAVGLLWIRRTVAMQCRFTERLIHPDNNDLSTTDAALQAYQQEIQPYHSWSLQSIVMATLRATTLEKPHVLSILYHGNKHNHNDHHNNNTNTTMMLSESERQQVIQELRQLVDTWQPLLEEWTAIYEALDMEDTHKV